MSTDSPSLSQRFRDALGAADARPSESRLGVAPPGEPLRPSEARLPLRGRTPLPPPVSDRIAPECHQIAHASDGTRLYVRRTAPLHGSVRQDAVIFCDGVLCDGFVWKYLWGELAEGGDVAHWHYRGHGRSGSPVDPERVTIEDHARDLRSVRDHLGDPPCVLVGHSMGTQVALEHWRRFPSRVRGLVLICGSYGRVTQTFRGVPILDRLLPKISQAVDKQPNLARALWSRVPPEVALKAALIARDVDPSNIRREDLLPYLEHMTHVDLPMFLKMLKSAGEHSAEEYLPQVSVPVLIIAGEKDTFTPAALSAEMARLIPNAELCILPKASHVAPLEQRDVVGERIRAFLERVGAQ